MYKIFIFIYFNIILLNASDYYVNNLSKQKLNETDINNAMKYYSGYYFSGKYSDNSYDSNYMFGFMNHPTIFAHKDKNKEYYIVVGGNYNKTFENINKAIKAYKQLLISNNYLKRK